MQINTKMKYHLTCVRIYIIKNTRDIKCLWGCGEKRKTFCTVDGNVHCTATMDTMEVLKKLGQ